MYYKIIHKIHRKIQANDSTIQSELGGGQNGLLGMAIQPATYQTVTRKDFKCLERPPQAAPVPPNEAAAKVPRCIQQHADQVEKWNQMVNAEVTLKHQFQESLDEKYFKGQRQVYIN